MRAGSPGMVPQGAVAIVAVTDSAEITRTTLEQRFRMLGYEVLEERTGLSRTRSDRAVVLHVFARGPVEQSSEPWSVAELAVTLLAAAEAAPGKEMLRQAVVSESPAETVATFQPVWSIERWCCTGLELLVVDDDDAFRQLDVLAKGIELSAQADHDQTAGWLAGLRPSRCLRAWIARAGAGPGGVSGGLSN